MKCLDILLSLYIANVETNGYSEQQIIRDDNNNWYTI